MVTREPLSFQSHLELGLLGKLNPEIEFENPATTARVQ